MPKTPRDFSKGLIYKIVCKTNETLIYVGSTTNFRQRTYKHKSICQNANNRLHNSLVYVMIRSNGGWTNFDMKPIKEFPCDNVIQLVIEEERIRKEIQANLNTKRAFSTEEEAKEQQKKTDQKYYQDHKEDKKEKARKYRKEHKAEVKEYHKKYVRENKDEINKKARENRLAKKISQSIV